MIDYQSLLAVRSGLNVRRFHTIPGVEETVGHHSAGVAALLLYLHYPQTPSAELLAAAVLHDVAEIATGDVPATAKWASSVLSRELDNLEQEWWKREVRMSEPTMFLSTDDLRILKIADGLDLAIRCSEEMDRGNKTVQIVLSNILGAVRASIRNEPPDSLLLGRVSTVITKLEAYE